MTNAITFTVLGIPAPQGSKTSGLTKSGHPFTREANPRTRPWRQAVAAEALASWQNKAMEGPVELVAAFFFPRPKSHYRTGKHSHDLRADAPIHHTSKPDLSKLVRAVEDAMTGIIYRDDSQISAMAPKKVYTESNPCAIITVRPL